MKPKQERRQLKELYDQIPSFKCVPGCHECCGAVPASREERKKAPHLLPYDVTKIGTALKGIAAIGCADCPHLGPSGCSVYEDRPFLCRLFGSTVAVEAMRCPRGARPANPLTAIQVQSLTNRYLKLTGMKQCESLP